MIGAVLRRVSAESGRAQLRRWRASALLRLRQPSSQIHYRATLYGLLNRAGEFFESLEDWRPPKFPAIEKPEPRSRVLTVDELTAICAEWRRPEPLPGESEKWRDYRLELYDIARMMLLTAARREEISQITANAIDWRNDWLNLHSGKVSRWHLVPLSKSAMALLARRRGREVMFQSFSHSIPHYVCRRIKAVGVEYGRDLTHGWTLHDFRRTAASLIESSGIPYSAVSALLGHRRQDVTAVYTPADREQLRRAVELLENFCRDIDGFLDDLAVNGESPRNATLAKAQ